MQPDLHALTSHFATEGYAILRGLLDAGDIETLRAWFPKGETAAKTTHIEDPALTKEAELRIFRRERVRELLASVLGEDFVVQRVHGREPGIGGGAQGLHADASTPLRGSRAQFATLIAYLDDADKENGATRLLPGSHRSQKLPGRRMSDPAFVHVAEVHICVQAGDAVVFNAHVWHSGSRNLHGRRRRAIQCSVSASAALTAQRLDEPSMLRGNGC